MEGGWLGADAWVAESDGAVGGDACGAWAVTVGRQATVAQGRQGAVWAGIAVGRETWAQTRGRQGAVRVGAAEAG